MGSHGRVALAKFVMRGKESLVLIRPAQGGLMLHTMYFADEVRSFGEIEKGESAKIKEGELQLALQLIDGLSSDTFSPEKYRDEYRERVLELVNQKVEGKEVSAAGPQVQRAQVIDLMEALKQSLARRGNLLALDLLVDELEHALAVLVAVLLGAEGVRREAVDQLERQLELPLLDLRRLALLDLAEAPHLIGEVHRVQHEPALRRPDEDEALLAAHDELRERDAPVRAHRVGEEPIRLLTALVGAQVVRLLEIDRVHRREWHELRDVDDLRRLALEALELLVGDAHVLVLRELVPADERRPVHDLVADRAEVLQLDAGAALGVEQVEGDGLRRRGRVELDRDRDQPERDRPGPGGVCGHRLHDSTMLPMMREGLTPPMDSVPLPVERRHLGVLTSLSAALLLAFVALATWLPTTGSPVADG